MEGSVGCVEVGCVEVRYECVGVCGCVWWKEGMRRILIGDFLFILLLCSVFQVALLLFFYCFFCVLIFLDLPFLAPPH